MLLLLLMFGNNHRLSLFFIGILLPVVPYHNRKKFIIYGASEILYVGLV
jgi:hypothetical protein